MSILTPSLAHDISYGMFSSEGNLAVHGLVIVAKTQQLTWPETYKCLQALARSDYYKFGEAMDTEVRECVYTELGFNTDFYI